MRLTEEILIKEMLYFREELILKNSYPNLFSILKKYMNVFSNKIFLIHCIPEQGEDIYEILVDSKTIYIIELQRSNQELIEIEILSLLDYYKKYKPTKVIKRKIDTAIELSKNL